VQELGKNFKTLGVGWAWEALRSMGHGTKTTFGAVSGIVGLQVGGLLLLSWQRYRGAAGGWVWAGCCC